MVQIKDRKKEIEYLRMSLNMVGIVVDYQTADLIIETQKVLKQKKGKMSLRDAENILVWWDNKWQEYFKNLRKNIKGK
jgi:hypothetical protein